MKLVIRLGAIVALAGFAGLASLPANAQFLTETQRCKNDQCNDQRTRALQSGLYSSKPATEKVEGGHYHCLRCCDPPPPGGATVCGREYHNKIIEIPQEKAN